MIRLFIIFFIILYTINPSFAIDLVLPKEKKSIVNTNYAFFVGKAKKSEFFTINNERIQIASNGAFAHSVKLKDGENRIILKTNFNTHIYKIYKNKSEPQIQSELVELTPQRYIVKKDNTPLRSTPIDFGMNRMSHLFAGTNIIVNGINGDFYRVYLSNNKIGWISKHSVEEAIDTKFNPQFVNMNCETFKNASINTIEFSEKLPYTIDETDSEIIFKVYNPDNSSNSVYTINIKKPEKYSYKTSIQNGSYIFKVTELPYCEKDSLDGLTIVIDAGHGGSEKGAIGCLGDYEKNINLGIALKLKDVLSSLGANVIMTRECDGTLSLEDRIKLAKDNCANIFISIHLNSIPDIRMDIRKNRGTSVYFYNQNSKELANIVEQSITNNVGTRDDGVKSASFAVIRPTEYVGILVEAAYMTNPLDSILYKSKTFSEEVAKAISEGILTYSSERKNK